MVMEVTSFIWAAVHSRSIYLLYTVISQLSQVFEPSPHGVLLQQILKCLFGSLTGPLILIPPFFAFPTKLLVTCWMASSLPELKVILVLLIYWSSTPYFLMSLSAMNSNKLIFYTNNYFSYQQNLSLSKKSFPLNNM